MEEYVVIKEVAPSDIPLDLLLQADPSKTQIEGYLSKSRGFTASLEGKTVGACVVQPVSQNRYELMNISVYPEHQRKGIGSKLLRHIIAFTREVNAQRLVVGTGTFGYQLKFYQREGFRVDAIEKDFFIINYDEPVYEDGIQLKDMLKLVLENDHHETTSQLQKIIEDSII